MERICDRIVSRLPAASPEPECSAIVARAGYLARVVERELFEPARAPMPGLAENLRKRLEEGSPWQEASTAVARELASGEPLERPAPDDPVAVSWRVPGPGGHVRHYVAQCLIAERLPIGHCRPTDEAGQAALKRDFMYGFMLRCCEEARPSS